MNKLTMSLVLTLALGAFSQISANEDVETQLSAIENASTAERSGLVKEFKFELKNMGEDQRIQAMHMIQEKMPELAQDIKNENIVEMINAIKDAKPDERRELMNSFKLEIAQMNEEERAQAITQMRTQMKTMSQEKTDAEGDTEAKHMYQHRNRVRAEKGQADNTQEMIRTEQMNQYQGANQFNNQDAVNTAPAPTSTQTQGFGQH